MADEYALNTQSHRNFLSALPRNLLMFRKNFNRMSWTIPLLVTFAIPLDESRVGFKMHHHLDLQLPEYIDREFFKFSIGINDHVSIHDDQLSRMVSFNRKAQQQETLILVQVGMTQSIALLFSCLPPCRDQATTCQMLE